MIEKAIVEEIIDNYNIRVRVPRYNLSSSSPHATPFSELPIAGICTLPGCNPVFRIGDIVIISYEGDEIDKPIIIGQLYAQNLLNNQIDINCSSLIVDVNTSLPEETNIGGINYYEIKQLSGAQYNLQAQIDLLEKRIEELEGNRTS
jgi:hypothetical protein